MKDGIRVFLATLHDYTAIAIPSITLLILIICPIPLCVGCEPDPFENVNSGIVEPLFFATLIASFLAGTFAIRNAWLVPLGTVFSLPLSHFLRGMSSVEDGLLVAIYSVPIFAICFSIGHVIHIVTHPDPPGNDDALPM